MLASRLPGVRASWRDSGRQGLRQRRRDGGREGRKAAGRPAAGGKEGGWEGGREGGGRRKTSSFFRKTEDASLMPSVFLSYVFRLPEYVLRLQPSVFRESGRRLPPSVLCVEGGNRTSSVFRAKVRKTEDGSAPGIRHPDRKPTSYIILSLWPRAMAAGAPPAPRASKPDSPSAGHASQLAQQARQAQQAKPVQQAKQGQASQASQAWRDSEANEAKPGQAKPSQAKQGTSGFRLRNLCVRLLCGAKSLRALLVCACALVPLAPDVVPARPSTVTGP